MLNALSGVRSQSTRETESRQGGVACATTWQTYSAGTVVSRSHSLLTTDKSHHLESLVKPEGLGGGQKLKAGGLL